MRKTYGKNALRTVKETFGRFVAIFAIVALGVGFLVGLLSAMPDTSYSFDKYFDDTSMYDIRVLGDLGLTDDDIAKLSELEGIGTVQPGYLSDVLMYSSNDTEFTVRMHSLDIKNGNTLNIPKLSSGRLPQNPSECVLINIPFDSKAELQLGETLTVSESNENTDDTLSSKEYKIVGFANYCPYFSAEKEYTNIGSGTVDLFMLVPNESFATDFYTDVYISVEGASALTSLTDTYQTLIDETAARVEAIAEERSQLRYDEVISLGTDELSAAKAEYTEAKTEAEGELSDANEKLTDGWNELESGKEQLISAWAKIIENQKVLNKNQEDLNKQESEIYAAISAAEAKLCQAQIALDSQLDTANKSLTASETELASYHLNGTQLSAFNGLRKLPVTYPALAGNLQALQTKSERLKEIEARLIVIGAMSPSEQAAYADEAARLKAESTNLQAEIARITSGEDYIAYLDGATRLAMTGAASNALPALALKLGSIDSALTALTNGQAEINNQRAQLAANKESSEKQIAEARAKIAEGRTQLANAKKTYFTELAKLNSAENTLLDSQSEYEKSKTDAETSLADGATEISEAETSLSEISVPSWYVYTREDNVSYSAIEANIDKVNAIAKVFPFFFFLVAALVALTTMTRMVEDERLQIGTMQALGYSRGAIMGKYILYAFSASLLGSAVGVAVGFKLLPTVIWNAFTMSFELPKFYIPVNWILAAETSGALILCTLLATINACSSTLKEKPAQLMLAKAPEAGKRVLLEKVPFIWNRLKFSYKITARNLFRYKKRFLMTSIGVAGCTALLVAGFGLRDSFSDIAERQFKLLTTYDILAPFADGADFEDAKLNALLSDKDNIADSTAVSYSSVTAENEEHSIDIYTFISEKTADLEGFISFRNRESGKTIDFTESSVIITEKASSLLKVNVGDRITITDNDGNAGGFTITGVCENYIQNYIYMCDKTYETGMGLSSEPNMLVVRLTEKGLAEKTNVGKALLDTKAISGVSYSSDSKGMVDRALGKMDIIVVVIVLSAGALALVVLYNLTNINISERVKEIATLKVLGFSDREVNSYINRESLILSIIGAIFGLALGFFLHRYIILSAEMPNMMFGRSIKAISFLYSAALTMAFTVLIDLIMRRKLRNISMVESMKAPE